MREPPLPREAARKDRGGDRPRISAALITLDAERTLGRSLESVSWADEIVVVDSGSTDATERIARAHGARFLPRDWPGYGRQKQRAVEATRCEWILSIDADEVVSPELAASIRRAIRAPEGRVAFRVPCHTRFMGAWLGGRGWWTDWKLRLFRAGRGRFNDARIHEGVTVDGPVGFLSGPLYHDPWRDVEHRLRKENRYSSLSAERDHRHGRRAGPLRPFARGLGWFLKEYVVRGGFLHGEAGFLHAGLTGVYAFHRWVKVLERDVAEEPAGPAERGAEAHGRAGDGRTDD